MSVITTSKKLRVWLMGFPSSIELLRLRFSSATMVGFWEANFDNDMLVKAYAQNNQTIEDYCKDYIANTMRRYLGQCIHVARHRPDKLNYIDIDLTYAGYQNSYLFLMYDATTHKLHSSNNKSDVIFCKENGVYTSMTEPANNGYNQIIFGVKSGYCGGFFVNLAKFGTVLSNDNTSTDEYPTSVKSSKVHDNVIIAYNPTIGSEFIAELSADEFKAKTDNGTFEEWLKSSKYLNERGTSTTTKEVTKITITNTETTLNIGDTTKITCDIEPTDADDKTFTLISSNDNVTINNDEITAVKKGTSNITAITKNNVKDTKQFTIQENTTPIEPKPKTTESKPITYKDNSNANVELNIDYSKQGDNLATFDFEKHFIDQKYGYDVMSVNFRFNTAEKYSYTPFINFIMNDGTIETTNGIKETSLLDYQYSCNIEFAENGSVFQFKPAGVTKWLDYSKLTKIEIACGVIAQISGLLPNDFNLIGVYEVTKENLSMLLQKNNRFIIRNYADSTETAENELVDLSKYLIMCYKSFIKLDFEKTNENIILGGYATNIKANEKTDLITVHETNEIVLNGFYGNSLDNDSEIILHLPNYNNYKLDSNFINHKLKLRFICDVTNNSMMIEIMIDDVTVDVVNSILGYRIPLLNGQTNSTDIINSYLFNQNSNIRIDVLYTEIVSDKITTNKKDMIKNFNGFTRFQYAQYNFSLTENEQKELNTILLNGVYLPNAV